MKLEEKPKLFKLECNRCGVPVVKQTRNGRPPVCYPCWEAHQRFLIQQKYGRKSRKNRTTTK